MSHEKFVRDVIKRPQGVGVRGPAGIVAGGDARDRHLRRDLLFARHGIEGALLGIDAVDLALLLINLVVLLQGGLKFFVRYFLLVKLG
jgi:hypothetical protein